MATVARKRPAAVLATTTKGPAMTSHKKSRTSADEYEKLACLGEGGFGVVQKARHRATGKIVATKHLSSAGADEAVLRREARFLETCNGNPYVTGFEGLVRDHASGNLCLVMEYVAAPTLHTFMWDRRHSPPLPESRVRAIMWKLLTGAKLMHDRHVVHRDIKPENILISEDCKLVKICDLGLSMCMSESLPYKLVGTVPYIAPEVLLGKPDYDALVDTWSLGCVMAEMLTGETLFEEDVDDDDDQGEVNDADPVVPLWGIFRVLGVPDSRTWPEFKSLPLTAEVLPLLPKEQKRNSLRDIFPEQKLSQQGFQVLQGLLTCNPEKRLTAAKALKLPWFADPRPSAAPAKVEALPLPRKKTPRFIVPLAVLKAQRV
jgi:cell division cycle 2-like protein